MNNSWHSRRTDELCRAILCLKNTDECYAFLEDICTIKELIDMSQRLAVAEMLSNGESYSAISRETGASAATISRVSKCYEYGAGGYKQILPRLSANKDASDLSDI